MIINAIANLAIYFRSPNLPKCDKNYVSNSDNSNICEAKSNSDEI